MKALESFLKPRTQIAFMLYGTFCVLALRGTISEEAVIAVVASLMTFYYATKINGKSES